MIKQVVLISCVSQKSPYRSTAKELYKSTLFRLNLKYAKLLNPDEIFVLSAKYGLLQLDQEIDPYNLTLNKMSINDIKNWSNKVIDQIRDYCSVDETEFILLAGVKYRKFLIPHFKYYKIPLEGLRIGEQLQKLKNLTSLKM